MCLRISQICNLSGSKSGFSCKKRTFFLSPILKQFSLHKKSNKLYNRQSKKQINEFGIFINLKVVLLYFNTPLNVSQGKPNNINFLSSFNLTNLVFCHDNVAVNGFTFL